VLGAGLLVLGTGA